MYRARMKVDEKQKAHFLKFNLEAYKQRLAEAMDEAGGITKFASKMGLDYQKVQGWMGGSLPRVEHWPLVEKTGRDMAWYLFGIEGEMNEKNMDRKAAVAAIKKLQEDLNALLLIVKEPVPDAKVEGAGFTKRKNRPPRAKKAEL